MTTLSSTTAPASEKRQTPLDISTRTVDTQDGTETTVFDIQFQPGEAEVRRRRVGNRVSIEWAAARELWGKVGDALKGAEGGNP